jgi:glycosyltransferase involved in cell wall biosynthesis
LRKEFSAKSFRVVDAFQGAAAVSFQQWRLRPSISRAWMWSYRGSDTLSRRLNAAIESSGDRGPFLQVGTLVRISSRLGPHFMRTDMTIPQARRANHFAVSALSASALREAEDVQRDVLAEAEHVFAASNWTASSLIEDFGVSASRVSVVYTGGNLPILTHIKEDRCDKEILFVGLDWERKGGPLLLEAFRIVKEQHPDSTLRVVGCSPQVNQPGVRIEGRLEKSDRAQYDRLLRCYLRAACFCLPTLFDPFPNVIVEASSVGLPSVAFDNGSRREAILHGETGLLVQETDPRALAAALCEILEDPSRSQRMGAAAKAFAELNFSWERAIESIGTIIRLKV